MGLRERHSPRFGRCWPSHERLQPLAVALFDRGFNALLFHSMAT